MPNKKSQEEKLLFALTLGKLNKNDLLNHRGSPLDDRNRGTEEGFAAI